MSVRLTTHGIAASCVIAVMILPMLAYATGRATKEQMAEFAARSQALWDAPGTNYNALSGGIIKPGVMSKDELLNRLNPMLAKADKAQDKAAVYYLIGETYYWGGLTELRKTRDKSVIAGLGDNAIPAYLTAWETIEGAASGPDATQLVQTVAFRLNQLLATEICGSALSTNVKQQVVARYIDRLPAAGMAGAVWTTAMKAKVFGNLGILDRLTQAIPLSMPTNMAGVCEALDLAMSTGVTNDALRFAAHLEEKYQADLAKLPEVLRKVSGVYRATGDPRAIPSLEALAAVDPKGWIERYEYAVRLDPKTEPEQRRKWVDAYLKGVEAKGGGKTMEMYWFAADRLVANGDYQMAIPVGKTGIYERGSWTQRVMIWRLLAISYEKCGEFDQAEAAFRDAALDAEQGGEELQTLCRKELEAFRMKHSRQGEKK
jgi:tetratricopeptide (TPR) repeat protein